MDSSKKLKTEPNMGKTFQIQFKLSFLVPHPHPTPTPTPTPTHMLQCEDVKCSSWILTICISFFVYHSFHFFQSFTWLKTGYILLVYDWKLNYLLGLFVKITVFIFGKSILKQLMQQCLSIFSILGFGTTFGDEI